MFKYLLIIYKRYVITDFIKVVLGKLLAKFNIHAYKNLLEEENSYLSLDAKDFQINRSGRYIEVKSKLDKKAVSILRRRTSDIYVYEQIFVQNEFQPLIDMIKNPHDIKFIIDAGANIGLSSIKFNSCFPNATIIPVEPDEENFKILTKNIKKNKIKALPINAGIWNKTTRLYFDRSFRDGKEWSIKVTDIPNEGSYIDSVSIKDILSTNNIEIVDILKIDIEGSEKQVFKNNNSSLDFLDVTKYIAIEIHEEFLVPEEIETILIQKGFLLSNTNEYLIGQNQHLIN